MAWTHIKEDYKDLAWDGLRKYRMVNNPDGTVSFEDVTVYTNEEESAFDSLDMNKIANAVNGLGRIVGTTPEETITNLGVINIEQVWENPDPKAMFLPQDIELPITEDDIKLIVEFMPSRGGDTATLNMITPDYKAYLYHFANSNTNSVVEIRTRACIYNSVAKKISFENGFGKSITNTMVGQQNSYCVPLRIYVIKNIKRI